MPNPFITFALPLKLGALLAAIVVLPTPKAAATLYTDHDVVNKTLSSNYRVHDGTFNILDDGYTPGQEHIVQAGFAFTFLDFDNRQETVRIDLGQDIVAYRNVSWGFNVFGGLLSGNAILDLSVDGIISYQVRWVYPSDSFTLLSGTLIAESAPSNPLPTQRVPDGGTTLSMLGMALLALGYAGRRFKRV